ncbi:MAG: hypothetical protein ACOVMM_02765 [Chitinophagaceae bacterium]
MKQNILIILTTIVIFTSCKKVDEAQNNSDHSAITTLIITFKQAGVTKYIATFDDPDGIGGNNPVKFDTIKLNQNQTYQADVVLQNKTSGTTKDMTAEIRTAGREHELFYTPNSVNVNITKTDVDILGHPLGLNSNWQTSTATTTNTATIKIQLKHKPFNKGPNDDVTKGHDDININFPIIIN